MARIANATTKPEAHEIEITPEMVEAGAGIVCRTYGDALIEGEYGNFDGGKIAIQVYTAMRRLSSALI